MYLYFTPDSRAIKLDLAILYLKKIFFNMTGSFLASIFVYTYKILNCNKMKISNNDKLYIIANGCSANQSRGDFYQPNLFSLRFSVLRVGVLFSFSRLP